MKETCEKCGGSGWIVDEKEGKNAARRCSCFARQRASGHLKDANIPKRYRHCEMESFADHLHPSHGIAKAAARRFIENYPSVDYGIMFLGPPGVGKTHLSVAVIKELMAERGASCYFQDFRELLQKIKDSYNPISQTTELEILRPVLERDVAVLDDLGASRSTDWIRDTLAYIINTRYNENRITLITSNYPDSSSRGEDSLSDRIGSRLRSRLYEMCKVFEMSGEDFRMKVKQAQYRDNR